MGGVHILMQLPGSHEANSTCHACAGSYVTAQAGRSAADQLGFSSAASIHNLHSKLSIDIGAIFWVGTRWC